MNRSPIASFDCENIFLLHLNQEYNPCRCDMEMMALEEVNRDQSVPPVLNKHFPVLESMQEFQHED